MDNSPILSDEDFSKINPQDFINKTYEVLENRRNQETQQQQPQQPVEQPPVDNYQQMAPQEQVPQEPVQTQYQQPQEQQPVAPQQNYDNPEQQSASSQESNVDPAIYKQAYEKILSPFKASGREFQARNIDEAISLMQMGVDYTRKQQALKPRLREMRTLEEQGMLGNNLNYAIDLYNGNPQALAKLIKEKGIDISKLMPQQNEFGEPVQEADTTPYTPTDHTLSEAQYEFKEVCDELRRTDMFNKVADTLEAFDESSKNVFRKNPKYLLTLGELLNSGAYEKIRNELDHLRIVDDPKVRGMNDFDAIDVIGRAMYGNGQPVQQPVPPVAPPPPQPQYDPQRYSQQQQFNMQQRKQAASPIRQAANVQPAMYDPLRCSDEEFMKIDVNQLLRNYR